MAEYTYEDILTLKDLLTGKITPFSVLDKKGWFFNEMPRDLDANVLYRMSSPRYLIRVMYGEKPFQSAENEWYEYFLPEKETIATAPEFKVGDRVRIRKEWEGWGADCAPTVGKIGYIYRFHYTQPELVLVGFSDDENCWFYDLDALELVGEADEKSYEERQAEWVKENNLKAGDKVRVLRKFEDKEQGFLYCYSHQLDRFIGKIMRVAKIRDYWIAVSEGLHGEPYGFPYFVLEKYVFPWEREYVPFDLSKAEDRDALRGKWAKLDQDGFFYEFQITEFIRICDEASTYMVRLPNGSQKTGEELLLFFVFLDGSPVGKLKEAGA